MKRKVLRNHRIEPRNESYNHGLRIREIYRILSSRDRNTNRIDFLSFYQAQSCKFEVPDISFVRQSEYFKAYWYRLFQNRCRTRSSTFETKHNLVDSYSGARESVILVFLAQIIEYSTVFILIRKPRIRSRASIFKIKYFKNRLSTTFPNRNSR